MHVDCVITARSPNPINGEGELKAVKRRSFITIGSSYRGGQGTTGVRHHTCHTPMHPFFRTRQPLAKKFGSRPSGMEKPSKTGLEWNLADDNAAFLCPISQEVMRDPVVAADGMHMKKKKVYLVNFHPSLYNVVTYLRSFIRSSLHLCLVRHGQSKGELYLCGLYSLTFF